MSARPQPAEIVGGENDCNLCHFREGMVAIYTIFGGEKFM